MVSNKLIKKMEFMANFCSNCGERLNEKQDICLKCGVIIHKTSTSIIANPNAKSRIIAGILALFCGPLGIHNFYLGYHNKAGIQLGLMIFGIISFIINSFIINALSTTIPIAIIGFFIVLGVRIWTFIEAIMLFVGTIKIDGKGNELIN